MIPTRWVVLRASGDRMLINEGDYSQALHDELPVKALELKLEVETDGPVEDVAPPARKGKRGSPAGQSEEKAADQ